MWSENLGNSPGAGNPVLFRPCHVAPRLSCHQLLAELLEPLRRDPQVLTLSCSEPSHTVAQVMRAAEDDQTERALSNTAFTWASCLAISFTESSFPILMRLII